MLCIFSFKKNKYCYYDIQLTCDLQVIGISEVRMLIVIPILNQSAIFIGVE
jgi:hypothetical protein